MILHTCPDLPVPFFQGSNAFISACDHSCWSVGASIDHNIGRGVEASSCGDQYHPYYNPALVVVALDRERSVSSRDVVVSLLPFGKVAEGCALVLAAASVDEEENQDCIIRRGEKLGGGDVLRLVGVVDDEESEPLLMRRWGAEEDTGKLLPTRCPLPSPLFCWPPSISLDTTTASSKKEAAVVVASVVSRVEEEGEEEWRLRHHQQQPNNKEEVQGSIPNMHSNLLLPVFFFGFIVCWVVVVQQAMREGPPPSSSSCSGASRKA